MATVIGKPPVSAMSTPRQISIVPSVTTKEWILNLTTIRPLIAPSSGADGDRRRRGDDRRHAEVAHQHHGDIGGEPEHGADREVEMSADHQERDADADDAELGGDRHHADVGRLGREQSSG